MLLLSLLTGALTSGGESRLLLQSTVKVDKPILTTSTNEFGPTISLSRGVVKDPSNPDSERCFTRGTQLDISKTADGPQIQTGSGGTTITGLDPDGAATDFKTRQNTVQVGLTADGPSILHQTYTTGKQDGQPFFGLRETTITPTAEGGPDITRLNLGRKILHRGEAV